MARGIRAAVILGGYVSGLVDKKLVGVRDSVSRDIDLAESRLNLRFDFPFL